MLAHNYSDFHNSHLWEIFVFWAIKCNGNAYAYLQQVHSRTELSRNQIKLIIERKQHLTGGCSVLVPNYYLKSTKIINFVLRATRDDKNDALLVVSTCLLHCSL